MTLETFNRLDETARFAATMFAYIPRPLSKTGIIRLIRHCLGADKEMCKKAFSALVHAKMIAKLGTYDADYVCRFDLRAKELAEVFRDAEAKGWLPDTNAILHVFDKNYYAEAECRHILVAGKCVRLLADGADAKSPAELLEVLGKPGGLVAARGAVWHASQLIVDEPDFSTVPSGGALARLIRYWLNIRFVQGHDVRKALVALETSFRSGGKWDWRLVASYAALCFWMGWRQGLDTAFSASACRIPLANIYTTDEDAKEALLQTLEACRFAMDGDFARADLAFKTAEKFDDELNDSRCTVECRQVENVPERLLSAMCAAVAKPEKIAKLRPAKVIDQTWYSNQMWNRAGDSESEYEKFIEDFSKRFAYRWKDVVSGRGLVLAKYNAKSVRGFAEGLPYAWDYRLLAAGRSSMRDKAASLFGLAEDAEREGYVNIAGLYLTLLSGGYDEAGAADFVERVSKASVRFLPEIKKEDEWKSLLNVVRKAVVDASKAEKREASASSVSVVWRLLVSESDGTFELNEVQTFLHTSESPEDGSKDEQIRSSWELDKKSVRRAFTDKDMSIVRALNASYYDSIDQKTRADLLPMLVGMENIQLRIFKPGANIYLDKPSAPKPVKVVSGRCEMHSSVSADGGVVLSVPKWALTTTEDVVLTPVDDSTIAVVSIGAGVRKLLSLFREIGVEGKIEIPASAMKEAAPLVEEMAALLPVAAPSESEKSSLRRVEASCAFAARLAFADDTLSVHIVVKPVAAMPSLVIGPGEGQPERVVADATGSYLLVRDLEAEKAKLTAVKSALADCETWHDGRSSWNVDDVPAALGALAALKALADADSGAFSMEWIGDKKVNVSNAPKSGVALGSTRTADDWFRVDGKFELDDGRVMSVAQMLDAARSRVGDYVKLSDGDYVRLTRSMARQIDALAAAGRRKGDGVEIPKAAIPMLDGTFEAGEDSLELPDAMAKTAEEIRAELARRPSVPKALAAELRPYQLEGYRWLSRLAGCGFGSCLADDMGLGKTVQVIALLLERAKGGASLVIAPSSVCGNWRSEIARFAPSLKPHMAYECEGELASFGPSDVVIASYGYLLFHEDEIASVEWNGLVLDEAQAVKNDASKRAKAVKRLKSKFRVAATGTPVENRLGELWSIFDFLNPGLLGAASSFASRFTNNGMATGALKRLVKPLVLRRLKGDVLDDLPEKTETTVMVELGKAERSAYEGCRVHALSQLEKDAEASGGEPNRMSILAELTRLRRFCCHPSLVLPEEGLPSAKMEALLDILSNLRESRHRALVFSQFTDYLAIVRKAIEARGWTHLYLDGSTPTAERGKLVDAFQGGEGDFFVISLKAGGTGLNLTAADYVILLDPWWNPAVEMQAADRAHRIGQRNPVTVYRLIASDTVEERVLELHKEKKQIAEDMLDGTGSDALSPAQLMGLFGSRGS